MKIKMFLNTNDVLNIELFEEIAPISCANFIALIKDGKLNNTIFHRVIDNFMIQGGGYVLKDNTLSEVEGVLPIKGEFSTNGIQNVLKHTPGVISMARTSDKNSATSQFFICVADCHWLDGAYAAFGKCDEESTKIAIELGHAETIKYGPFDDFPTEVIMIDHAEVVEE